jgi:hypothetical protein
LTANELTAFFAALRKAKYRALFMTLPNQPVHAVLQHPAAPGPGHHRSGQLDSVEPGCGHRPPRHRVVCRVLRQRLASRRIESLFGWRLAKKTVEVMSPLRVAGPAAAGGAARNRLPGAGVNLATRTSSRCLNRERGAG